MQIANPAQQRNKEKTDCSSLQYFCHCQNMLSCIFYNAMQITNFRIEDIPYHNTSNLWSA